MAERQNLCPVCDDQAVSTPEATDSFHIECKRCGPFRITRTAKRELRGTPLEEGQQRANASGWIRSQGEVTLSHEDLPRLRSLSTPSIPERGRLLLQHLASRNPGPGAHVTVNYGDPELQAVARCGDVLALRFVLAEYLMEEKGFLRPFGQASMSRWNVIISPKGWVYLSPRGRARHSPYAFVAMNFVEETKALRDEGIKPAILLAGFDTRIVDELDHNQHIDDVILANIRRSRFLIADLTFNRQNVYYEAGFAQGLGLEVIWTVRKDHLDAVGKEMRLHLDVRQFLFVPWTDGELPDFRERLANRIVRTVGPGPRRPT